MDNIMAKNIIVLFIYIYIYILVTTRGQNSNYSHYIGIDTYNCTLVTKNIITTHITSGYI
jgi:hypothetical protein